MISFSGKSLNLQEIFPKVSQQRKILQQKKKGGVVRAVLSMWV
jgi:hypothetical protein